MTRFQPSFQAALQAFDDANAEDPKKITVREKEIPYEWIYSQWLEAWVKKLDPEASEALLLAARCQHLRRWKVPRTDYDPGRIGYLKWRKFLYQFHADEAGEILQKLNYPPEIIEKVQAINLKKNLKDPDTQTMEDALSLVFLEHQMRDFLKKTPIEKMPDILKKTWAKMSPKARDFALKLPFSPDELALIQKSLA